MSLILWRRWPCVRWRFETEATSERSCKWSVFWRLLLYGATSLILKGYVCSGTSYPLQSTWCHSDFFLHHALHPGCRWVSLFKGHIGGQCPCCCTLYSLPHHSIPHSRFPSFLLAPLLVLMAYPRVTYSHLWGTTENPFASQVFLATIVAL